MCLARCCLVFGAGGVLDWEAEDVRQSKLDSVGVFKGVGTEYV